MAKLKQCIKCGEIKLVACRDMCNRCYQYWAYHNLPEYRRKILMRSHKKQKMSTKLNAYLKTIPPEELLARVRDKEKKLREEYIQ